MTGAQPPAAGPPQAELADRLIAEGNVAENAGDIIGACAKYRDAVHAAPRYAVAHLNLGIGLFASGELVGAAAALEEALVIEPSNPFVNYNLAIVVRAQGDLPRAVKLLRAAVAAKPDFVEALILLANLQEATGHADEAAARLREALFHRPDHAGAYNNLGALMQAQGKTDEAIASYRNAVSHQPDYVDALGNLAIALRSQGKPEAALVHYRKLAELNPHSASANLQYADLLKSLRKHGDAALAYRRAISLQPDLFEAHYNLGNLLRGQGDFAAAADSFRAALALRPEHPDAHNDLGIVLQMQGRLDDAIVSYRKAVSLLPEFAGAHSNLGGALQALRRNDEAIACFEKAIALQPNLVEALYNLGNLHDFDEALPFYRRALEVNPDYAQARWGIALSQQLPVAPVLDPKAATASTFEAALAELDAWFDATHIDEGVNAVGSLQPFLLAYQEENNRDLLAKYGKLCVRLMRHWQDAQGLAPGRGGVGKVLRIGIASAHIRDQSVWNAIVRGWFARLDRARFSLHVFHLGTETDRETAFARSRAAHFEQNAQGLRQWAEAIAGQQLDVLIYPEIGMDPTTVKLASLRLVPVQMTTWGHPETSGLPTIDYYLSAQGLEPANAQEGYTEELVLLPNLGCCYQSLAVAAIAPDDKALGLRSDGPLLLCAGAPYKYAPRYDAVLVAIARELGRCQFVFCGHGQDALTAKLRRRLESAFADAGLALDDFAVFIPWQPRPAFFGLLGRCDVYLDTIGFSGFNTAMQAVECALPIVTREGNFLRGRLASGILKRMGLAELVAATEAEYVSLAVGLARDVSYRQSVRERIAGARHILYDDVAPVRALEAFFETVARRTTQPV